MEKDKEPLLREYLNKIKKIHPIVHCITNTITVNDCANMVLALGASPTMAHHTLEVEEITAGTTALVCNLGATECLEAMELAGEKAAALGHPIVLDPVGVAGSTFRRNKCMALMERVHPTCIRGNYSEILALMRQRNTAVGVDAADTDMDLDALQQFADEVHGIVVASGEKDYITDGKRLYVCERGHRMMSHITGSGCMSSVALATFLAVEPSIESANACCHFLGQMGELAAKQTEERAGGTMTFRELFLDAVSLQGVLGYKNTQV